MNYWKYKDFVRRLSEFKTIAVYCNGKRLEWEDINKCVDCVVIEFSINARNKMAVIQVNGVY